MWQKSTFWILLRITMKPCTGVLWNWDFLSPAFSWIHFSLAQWFHSGRYSWRKMHKWAPSAGRDASTQIRTPLFIPATHKQAALSWVISISVITHQHVHKQTGNKSWLNVHTSNVVANIGSQKTNQTYSKENSKTWVQFSAWYFSTKTCILFTKHP